MSNKLPQREGDLVNAVLDYLHIRHIYCWRNNTGAFKRDNHFFRFGKKGSSDILGILPGGTFLAIECKVGHNKPSPEQAEFLDAIHTNGGVAIVAYDLTDVIDGISKLVIHKTK